MWFVSNTCVHMRVHILRCKPIGDENIKVIALFPVNEVMRKYGPYIPLWPFAFLPCGWPFAIVGRSGLRIYF